MGLDRADGNRMLTTQQSDGFSFLQIAGHNILDPFSHGAGAGHVGFHGAGGVDTDLGDIQFKLKIVIFKAVGRHDHCLWPVAGAAPERGCAVVWDGDEGHLGGVEGGLFLGEGEEVVRYQKRGGLRSGFRPGLSQNTGPVPRLREQRVVVATRRTPGVRPAIQGHGPAARSSPRSGRTIP